MTPLLSTKRLRMVLAVLGLGGMHGLVQAQSPATDSLRQIEYRLHKDPGASVEPALRDLVQRPGQYVAMRLLADVLAGSGQSDKIREAMRWYQQAFAQGRGEVNALLSLVRMVAKHGADRAQHEAFFADAVARFSPQRDFGSLRTALEIFFVYPTLYSVRQVEDMLALYAQSCISDCVAALFRARLAERKGDFARAEQLYHDAIRAQSRAVTRYYDFLGEQYGAEQIERFVAFSDVLAPAIESLPTDVVQAVGARLSVIVEQHDSRVVTWLDHAIGRGSLDAMVSKVEYLIRWEKDFGPAETFALIDQIAPLSPQHADNLRANAYLVRLWTTFNPDAAYKILTAQLESGRIEAHLGLGRLYTIGGLDEVDQVSALSHYATAARQGLSIALYRMATIHEGGRAICRDKHKALALAQLAKAYGQSAADPMVERLTAEMDEESLRRVKALREAMARELGLGV